MAGVSLGGTDLLGPSGSDTPIGVNVGGDEASDQPLAIDVLAGDGTVINAELPTTVAETKDVLDPVNNLVGAVLGDPAGDIADEVTDAIAPTVTTVTTIGDQVVDPVAGAVNGVLGPIAGDTGLLGPVTGEVGNLVDQVVGGLPGEGSGPAGTFDGPLIGTTVGDQSLTGPSTPDTIAGVNLLSDGGSSTGGLITADVLADGNVLDVSIPTTTAGVQSGLDPIGDLVGTTLGSQAGDAVHEVTDGLAPVISPVNEAVDSVVSPVLDDLNGAVGDLPSGGSGGDLLGPVTDTVDGLLGGETGGGELLAPVTDTVDGLLGGDTGTGNLLAPVTDTVGDLTGGGTEGGLLAPVTSTVDNLLGGHSSTPTPPAAGGLLGGLLNGT